MSVESVPSPTEATKKHGIPLQSGGSPESVPASPDSVSTLAARALAVTRVVVGFVFLWAFLDKLFGLHYSTAGSKSWLSGGSPTKGFLGSVAVGPFQSLFHDWAGAAWCDTLFMLALAGVGIALILGVAMRLTAISATLLLLMMWAAEWPLAQHTATGAPSMSVNPLIDYHIIYALVIICLTLTGAGCTWGLGKIWNTLPIIEDHVWLR